MLQRLRSGRTRTTTWSIRAAVLILVVCGVAAAIVLQQAMRIGAELERAEDVVDAAVDDLRDGDLDAARAGLQRARSSLEAASGRRTGWLWQAAGAVPVLGASPRTVETVTETALGGVRLAADLVDAAVELEAAAPAPGLPLDALRQVGTVADSPDVAAVAAGHRALSAPAPGPLPGRLHDAREQVAAASGQLLDAVRSVDDGVLVLDHLLGGDGARRFLVAMQNSAELRGTGGLIGFHAVLATSDGQVTLSDPEPDERVRVPEGTVALPTAQAEWLGHLQPTVDLKNVNLDPDFTRSGPLVVDVFEAATGDQLDGVIALDPAGLAALVPADAALEVPEDLADASAGLSHEVPRDRLARTLLVDAYQALGGESVRRQDFQAAVATAAMGHLVDLALEPAMLDALAFALEGRHVQVHVTDPAVQAAVVRLGLAGDLTAREGEDLLAMTVNNAGGGKPDVHVRHSVTGAVEVTPSPGGEGTGERHAELTFGLSNPLRAADWDDYIVRTSLPGQGPVEELKATNRTWVTTWAPATSEVLPGPDRVLDVGTLGGMLRVDHLLETPSEAERDVTVGLSGPVSLDDAPDGMRYRVRLWHQAKGIADHVDVSFRAGPGWVVASGDVSGRDDVRDLGFDEERDRLAIEVVDGVARVRGSATSDVSVELLLVPS